MTGIIERMTRQGFPCLFHLLTGLYCPGCGGTRAVRAMMAGNLGLSFQSVSYTHLIMGEEIEETGDFVVDEKDKVVNLTEQGVKKVEEFFRIENLADPENLEIQHNIILALRANNLICLLYTSRCV